MTRRRFQILLGSLLVILSLIISQIPTVAESKDVAKSSDFEMDGTTLVKYTGTAKTVSVPDSVKDIAPEAFLDNTYMTSLTIPDSVQTIGMTAFSGCTSLTDVKIGNGVETIGNAAFSHCTSLKNFSVGSELKDLGSGVFIFDNQLKEVKIASDRFVFEGGVIYNKDKTEIIEMLSANKFESYKMPNTVTDIRPYSFYGCNKVQTVELSPNIDNIPAYAFSGCTGITSMKIPYAVDSIDIKAFENCVNLKDVTMRESVLYIHPTAFDGCSKLNIIAPENSYAAEWFKTFDTSNVVIIENEDNDKKEETETKPDKEYTENKVPVTLPVEGQIAETRIVGRTAVFYINNSEIAVKDGPSAPSETDIYSEMVSQDVAIEDLIRTETNGKGLSLPKFTVIGDTIAARAFYQDGSLKAYEIANDINKIDDFAFSRSALEDIIIPDSVTHIGYGAFYHCDNLATISVPSSVTTIEPSAFAKTRMMENWLMYGNNNFLIMGDSILVAYKGNLSSVIIPDGVKQIGPECFKDHLEIIDVTIPDSCSIIGEDAFAGCSRLKKVLGGTNIEKIEDRAFDGCPIETIRIPDSVKYIGVGAFNLNSTVLPQDKKVAVFYGDEIPKLSYNKTATRMTNDRYRTDALSGVNVCIVDDESILRNETVLDRNVSGFSGIICVITAENDAYSNGILKIIDCTLNKDEAANIVIPSTVYAFGKGYNFDIDELNSVMDMARQGQYIQDAEPVETVTIPGTQKEYVLSVSKGSELLTELQDAYRRIYGDTIPANFTSYDISLRESDNEVILTKLGQLKLPVSIKLPDNMPSSNVHVICLDENYQLEDIPYEIKENNGELYINFEISHTGSYGLYSFNSTEVSMFDLDDTPDTGDWVQPKWLLCIGLFTLGLALILYKGRNNQIA